MTLDPVQIGSVSIDPMLGLLALLGLAVLALLTGLSRIYVGAHYPSQVLLGWVCGALCALIAVYTWGAYARLRSGRSHGKIAPVASDNSE